MDGSPAAGVFANVAYVAAYLGGIFAFASLAKRRGIATDGIALLALAGLLGGAAGAQLVQSFAGGAPGKSLLGGVAVGYVAVVLTKRRLGIRRPTGDLFAVGIAAGEAVGRIGCFFAGCCFGKVTGVAWAVHQHGGWRHPTQLYSAAAAALTLGVLVALERRRALPENGLFYVQGTLACAFRFAIEFYRAGPALALDLTAAQLACLGGVAFFAWKLRRLCARDGAPSVPRRTVTA